MIPTFPEFKKLEFSDKEELERYTEQYPPYSDFCFASLWAWNVRDEMELAWLKGNLVIRFTDYVMGTPFYTFLGHREAGETVDVLLALSEKNGYGSALGLVPEVSVQNLDPAVYDAFESREHFDYVYEVEQHFSFAGGKLKSRRNFLNGFLKKYPHYTTSSLDLESSETRTQILELCRRWEENKGYPIPNDAAAHQRFLESASSFNYAALGIFLEGVLIGYCTTVLLTGGNASALFERADTEYHGVHALLRSEVAKDLHKRGFPHLNYEQDLGIQSLRQSKLAFNPSYFLKKYVVSRKQG
jgi:uncharacterized protein